MSKKTGQEILDSMKHRTLAARKGQVNFSEYSVETNSGMSVLIKKGERK